MYWLFSYVIMAHKKDVDATYSVVPSTYMEISG